MFGGDKTTVSSFVVPGHSSTNDLKKFLSTNELIENKNRYLPVDRKRRISFDWGNYGRQTPSPEIPFVETPPIQIKEIKKKQVSLDDVAKSLEIIAGPIDDSRFYVNELNRIQESSIKLKIIFSLIYIICSIIIYITPLICVFSVFAPDKIRLYIISICSIIIIITKIITQIVHPKRQATRASLIAEKAKNLKNDEESQKEVKPLEILKLKNMSCGRVLI